MVRRSLFPLSSQEESLLCLIRKSLFPLSGQKESLCSVWSEGVSFLCLDRKSLLSVWSVVVSFCLGRGSLCVLSEHEYWIVSLLWLVRETFFSLSAWTGQVFLLCLDRRSLSLVLKWDDSLSYSVLSSISLRSVQEESFSFWGGVVYNTSSLKTQGVNPVFLCFFDEEISLLCHYKRSLFPHSMVRESPV